MRFARRANSGKGRKNSIFKRQRDEPPWCVRRIVRCLSWLVIGGVRWGAGEAKAGEGDPEETCLHGQKGRSH